VVGFSAEHRDWNVTVNSALDNVIGKYCWTYTNDDTWFEDDDHSLDDWPGLGDDPVSDGPKAFEAIHGVLNWWQVNMGRIGWDGEDGDHDLYIQVTMERPNANWNKGCKTMQFSRGMVAGDIVGHDRVIGAVVTWGASQEAPGVYAQTSPGGFILGRANGQIDAKVEQVAALLRPVGEARPTDNIIGARWSKLAINASIGRPSGVVPKRSHFTLPGKARGKAAQSDSTSA
jgi:hypothetical protein